MSIAKTFLLVLISVPAMAEQMVFEMSVFGYTFGTMVLTHTVENDSTELYTLNAHGKTDFFFMKREEQSKFEVRYRHGKLHSSTCIYLNKGVKEKWSTIQFDGNRYVVHSNEGDKFLTDAPDYSLIRLYFEPNWNRNRVFCEEDCSYATMARDPKAQTIDIHCQDGSRSTYYLNKGKLDRMEIHLAVATVKLKRVK